MTGTVSLGVAAALGVDAIAELAPIVERAGFSALWINDTPGADALAAALAALAATERLVCATGVIPVDRRPPAELLPALADAPHDRLIVGVGSGALRTGAVAAVTEAVERLHEGGVARVYVGALGPRMRRAGAAVADGVLLNWVPAAEVARQRRALRKVSAHIRVAVYVRTALDDRALPRLRAEAARYGTFPAYAAHFSRLGVDAIDTVFAGEAALRAGIPEYRLAADEVVLRAVVAEDEVSAYADFAERAAVATGLR